MRAMTPRAPSSTSRLSFAARVAPRDGIGVPLPAPHPLPDAHVPGAPQPATPRDGTDETWSPPDLVIDEEVRALIPPPSAEERAGLERQLLRDGCLDALAVWAEQRVLLDGHTRLELCRRHDLRYRTAEVSLPSREAAIAWVLARQAGRRNLTPEGRSYLRGQRYLRERRRPGGTGSNQHGPAQRAQNEQSAAGVLARLAAECKVGAATIRRDARFATEVDALAASCGAEVKGWVLARDARLTRRDVARLALLSPAEQRQVLGQARRDGRLTWADPEDEAARRITVPVQAEALARALVRRLGRERAAETCRALAEALGTERSAPPEPPGRA
jgi:hypothetical protein